MAIVWKEIGGGFTLESIDVFAGGSSNTHSANTTIMFKNNGVSKINVKLPSVYGLTTTSNYLQVKGFDSNRESGIELAKIKYLTNTSTQETISLLDSTGAVASYVQFIINGQINGTATFSVEITQE